MPGWVRTLASILLVVLFSKILEHLSADFRELLQNADKFFSEGVNKSTPFHFCAVFYGHILKNLSAQRNGNFGAVIAAAIISVFQSIGTIMSEGPVAVVTAALVLFIGVYLVFDRKAEHPFFNTLFFAPLVGGCLVYLLYGVMVVVGAVFGAGGRAIAYLGTFPLVKKSPRWPWN